MTSTPEQVQPRLSVCQACLSESLPDCLQSWHPWTQGAAHPYTPSTGVHTYIPPDTAHRTTLLPGAVKGDLETVAQAHAPPVHEPVHDPRPNTHTPMPTAGAPPACCCCSEPEGAVCVHAPVELVQQALVEHLLNRHLHTQAAARAADSRCSSRSSH